MPAQRRARHRNRLGPVQTTLLHGTGGELPKLQERILEHAKEEQAHADSIAERIVQLGGEPNLFPQGLVDRSHSEYAEGTTLEDMIREDLVAERIAIDSTARYRVLGGDDPTTRRLEEVTTKEEEHAEDLAGLLAKS